MLLNLLRTDPLAFVLIATALLFALVLHELGHAVAALWAGDPTAKNMGRLTLNPLKHLDPLGTLLLLFVGFGWARPVPIDPRRFRHYRVGLFVVSIAGIAVNLILSLLTGILLSRLVYVSGGALYLQPGVSQTIASALLYFGIINLVLAVFNLLPIPPLDGSKILQSLLPASAQPFLWQLERYSLITFVLIMLDLQFNGPISRFLRWAQANYIMWFMRL